MDRFILVRRPDRGDDVGTWQRALERHGLGDRIGVVLDSVDPEGMPGLELPSPPVHGKTWRGQVRGLRRDADFARLPSDVRTALLEMLRGTVGGVG